MFASSLSLTDKMMLNGFCFDVGKKVILIFLKEGAFVALVFSIFRTLRWPSEPIEVLM